MSKAAAQRDGTSRSGMIVDEERKEMKEQVNDHVTSFNGSGVGNLTDSHLLGDVRALGSS